MKKPHSKSQLDQVVNIAEPHRGNNSIHQ
jgi:hypothetical protein